MSSMLTANSILQVACRVMLILLLNAHLSACIHLSTNSTCARDPQSCLLPHTVAHIAELAKCCLYVEDEALPYKCAIFHPRTVPYGYTCEECSHREFGCPKDHERGEGWQKVCDFFCPFSPNPEVTVNSDDQKHSEPQDSGSKTSKIVIIVFCLLVLAMPCIIVVVICFESIRRYRSHTRSRNNSPITRLIFQFYSTRTVHL